MSKRNAVRNLDPHGPARVAMVLWGKEYSEQRGGVMDFWDKLEPARKLKCMDIWDTARPSRNMTDAEIRSARGDFR